LNLAYGGKPYWKIKEIESKQGSGVVSDVSHLVEELTVILRKSFGFSK
jgi:hypothetical protein